MPNASPATKRLQEGDVQAIAVVGSRPWNQRIVGLMLAQVAGLAFGVGVAGTANADTAASESAASPRVEPPAFRAQATLTAADVLKGLGFVLGVGAGAALLGRWAEKGLRGIDWSTHEMAPAHLCDGALILVRKESRPEAVELPLPDAEPNPSPQPAARRHRLR